MTTISLQCPAGHRIKFDGQTDIAAGPASGDANPTSAGEKIDCRYASHDALQLCRARLGTYDSTARLGRHVRLAPVLTMTPQQRRVGLRPECRRQPQTG